MPKQPYSPKHEADECTANAGDRKGQVLYSIIPGRMSPRPIHTVQRDGLETTLSVM